MSQGQDDTMQGLGCGRGCTGYQWVQGVDGLGNTVGYWQPTQPLVSGAPYARNAAPFFGEIAEAADGNLYQWVQGVDGLGSPFGFWKRLKRLARRALPIVQRIAPFVPGGAAALTAATPFLKHAGVAGLGDVGALELALLEQPLEGQSLQGAAQRVTADAELRRQVGLDDPLAGRERPGEDALADVVGDLGGEGPAQHTRARIAA